MNKFRFYVYSLGNTHNVEMHFWFELQMQAETKHQSLHITYVEQQPLFPLKKENTRTTSHILGGSATDCRYFYLATV